MHPNPLLKPMLFNAKIYVQITSVARGGLINWFMLSLSLHDIPELLFKDFTGQKRMPENPFFKLNNDIIDTYLSKISGNDLKCYLFILRKTIGWNKKKDKISISQIIKNTGIKNRETVINSTAHLAELGLITVYKSNGMVNIYEPKPVPKNRTSTEKSDCINRTTPVLKNRTTTSTKKPYPTKDTNTKDTLTKDKESKPKKNLIKVEMPENLNEPAWNEWIDYKKEIKKPYKTERGIKTAMNKLAAIPYENQKACIDNSISNEYQGFFPEKFTGQLSGNQNNNKETVAQKANRLSSEHRLKNMGTNVVDISDKLQLT